MLLKVLLRVCLLLVPAGVVVGMVAPYTFIEGMTREFEWIGRAVNVLGRITPGRELDDLISFALLGFVAHFVWRVSRPRQVETGILAIGVLVEIVQIWIPGREATVSHAPPAPCGRDRRLGRGTQLDLCVGKRTPSRRSTVDTLRIARTRESS
jgi:hypothetical protein